MSYKIWELRPRHRISRGQTHPFTSYMTACSSTKVISVIYICHGMYCTRALCKRTITRERWQERGKIKTVLNSDSYFHITHAWACLSELRGSHSRGRKPRIGLGTYFGVSHANGLIFQADWISRLIFPHLSLPQQIVLIYFTKHGYNKQWTRVNNFCPVDLC